MKQLVLLGLFALSVEGNPPQGRALISTYQGDAGVNSFNLAQDKFILGSLGAPNLLPTWSANDLDMSHHFLALLPDFSSSIDGLSSSGGMFRPSQMIKVFYPILRDAYMLLANGQSRNLTKDEEANLDLAETIMTLSVGVVDDMIGAAFDTDVEKSVKSFLDITRPIVEAWAERRHRSLTREEKNFLYYFENGYEFFFEIMKDFKRDNSRENMIKTNSKIADYFLTQRAVGEGRSMSPEERKLITEIEKQIFVNFEIMEGFAKFNNSQQVIDTIVLLTKYIFENNAYMELPRRYHLDHKETALIATAKKAMTEVDSMLNEIELSGLSYDRFHELGATTRKMWEDQAKQGGKGLTEKEREYLKFSDGVAKLANILYVRY
ncbi:unnamed protein product [Meganyctiphanes norvegica]|uniref:Uncharacterized protein n=1 Tax=Meganyctiphanes norvegica TaxID=48144 RepID=A0AAV2QH44_MEGNR